MPSFSLRAAQSTDLGFSFDVTEAAMRGYVEQTWGKWESSFQRKNQESFKTETHQVILVAGEPAGILAVESSPTNVQLEKLYLLPHFRNKGIGSQVLQVVLESAATEHKPVHLRTLAVNVAAQRFYVRHGFAVARVTPERVLMEAPPRRPGSSLEGTT